MASSTCPKTLVTVSSAHLIQNPSFTSTLHLASSLRFNSLTHARPTRPHASSTAVRAALDGNSSLRRSSSGSSTEPRKTITLPGCDNDNVIRRALSIAPRPTPHLRLYKPLHHHNQASLLRPYPPPLSSAPRPTPHLSSHLSFQFFQSRFQSSEYISDDEFFQSRFQSSEGKYISDDDLKEGCDYKHWLIVMRSNPALCHEAMIKSYLTTLATVLGSMDEAKKNMYAFSTTTYTGFQCTVSEETSEKFKGLPGVLWVLPDSYIDVPNKDYGGDKYINGEIIPCTYPTYQPKPRGQSKSQSRRYERKKNGPPGSVKPRQEDGQSPGLVKPRQEDGQSESNSQ